MLHCRVTGENRGNRIALGRPWRDYSTVLFYDTEMVQKIDGPGWLEWGDRLKTSTYREYKSHGAGVNGGNRSVVYSNLTSEEELKLSANVLLAGDDTWDSMSQVQKLRLMV